MRNNKLIYAIFIFTAIPVFAQSIIETDWLELQSIRFEEKYIEEVKGYMLFPKFPDNIKKMNGKIVQIEGYIIPFDNSGAVIALSANPFSACFFCGKAGPASIMTVKLKEKKTDYRTDAYKKFKGTLRLNDHDINEFYYVLENAEQVK